MSHESLRRVDAANLRHAGRRPETPFCVSLAEGDEVVVRRLLRVLPGKRIVGEAEWRGQRVLAKLFVAEGSVRHWAKEKNGIEALQQAHLPTPDLLLAAALPAGGHVLLTAFLDGAKSLSESWISGAVAPVGSAVALEVLQPAFRMLGALHASGLAQEDLHLGNFLRDGDTVFIIDGDAIRAVSPGQPLAESSASGNLAVLLAQLSPAWDACREELMTAYLAGGGCPVADRRALERDVRRRRAWRLKDYLGKTLRDCSLFSVRRETFRFSAVRRDAEEGLLPLLNSLDEAIARGTLLKDGHTCTVALVRQGDHLRVIKRYNLKNLKHALERCWRPSRAWHSWREGHRLDFLGIATPAPLALVEERVGPLRRRAFLINAYCPGVSLLEFLSPDQEPPEAVALEIQSLFQRLHDQRISHGDLKATNLLWSNGRLVVIDLDAVMQHRSERGYARAWRRDRSRLLRNWPASSVLFRWLDRVLPPAGDRQG